MRVFKTKAFDGSRAVTFSLGDLWPPKVAPAE